MTSQDSFPAIYWFFEKIWISLRTVDTGDWKMFSEHGHSRYTTIHGLFTLRFRKNKDFLLIDKLIQINLDCFFLGRFRRCQITFCLLFMCERVLLFLLLVCIFSSKCIAMIRIFSAETLLLLIELLFSPWMIHKNQKKNESTIYLCTEFTQQIQCNTFTGTQTENCIRLIFRWIL